MAWRAGEESHEHMSDELLAARAYLSTDERRHVPRRLNCRNELAHSSGAPDSRSPCGKVDRR